MLAIPIVATPSQVLTVQLSGQPCQIAVYQKTTGFYLDLSVNNAPIATGVICQNDNRIVRSVYLGFIGDLAFHDTQGADDPLYTGLGDRFVLLYLEAGE